MRPTLFLMASLLLGLSQAAEAQDYSGFRRSGWTTIQSRTHTKTYGNWTRGGWATTSGRWTEDRPGAFRLGERIGSLFGRRAEPSPDGWTRVPRDEEADYMERTAPIVPEERPALVTAPPLEEESRPIPAPAAKIAPAPLPAEVEAQPSRPAPTRIALTPGGEVTIEAVDADAVPDAEPEAVTPAAFDRKAKSSISLHPRYVSRLGHADDYSSITGQLRVANGVYELHYAAPGRVDRLGGVVVLEMKGDLSPLQNGDLIDARGHLLTHRDGTVVYRPNVIQILERE